MSLRIINIQGRKYKRGVKNLSDEEKKVKKKKEKIYLETKSQTP